MNTKATTGPNDRLVDYIAVVGVGDVLDPIQEESAFNPRREVTLQLVKPLLLLLLLWCAMVLCMHALTTVGWLSQITGTPPLELSFRAQTLQRYPVQDYQSPPYPTGIGLFCFPDGLRLRYTHTHTGAPSTTPRRSLRSSPSYRNPPLPSFFTFVATGGTGLRLYGHCLTFYEPLTPTQAESFKQLEVGASASSAATHSVSAHTITLTLARCTEGGT